MELTNYEYTLLYCFLYIRNSTDIQNKLVLPRERIKVLKYLLFTQYIFILIVYNFKKNN